MGRERPLRQTPPRSPAAGRGPTDSLRRSPRVGRPLWGLVWLALLLHLPCGPELSAQELPPEWIDPVTAGFDPQVLAEIAPRVERALTEQQLPGCVVACGRARGLVYLAAFGQRAVEPDRIPMTVDTLFDLASLTKPIATATSIHLLAERGQLALTDPVARHLPGFGQRGKQELTLFDLLTHQSGLLADNALSDYQHGPAEAIRRICALGLKAPRGSRFLYSDVNYIVLGEVVRRVSGVSLAEFTRQEVFGPLGMGATGYRPGPELRERVAPTTQRGGKWICGEVHDPRAHLLEGVAGHAGLFATAADLARYARCLLQRGRLGERVVLRPETVATLVAGHNIPGTTPGSSVRRTPGWDQQSGYSINRGVGFSPRAFGHGGFTGTVIWFDPELDLFFLFLSNRVHPAGKGSVNRLAGELGTLFARALRDRPAPPDLPCP